MAAEIELQGLAELSAALKQLPRELSSRNGGPLRAALAQAAKVIRDQAQAMAPQDSGLLKREIRMVRARDPGSVGANEQYLVGVRRGKRIKYADTRENRRKRRVGKKYQDPGRAYYWRFLEFGTERMAARPFLRPAFEAKKEEAAMRFRDSLREGIQRAVKKVAAP